MDERVSSQRKTVKVKRIIDLPYYGSLYQWWAGVLAVVNEAHDESTGETVYVEATTQPFEDTPVLEITTYRWETDSEMELRLKRQEQRRKTRETKREEALKKEAKDKEKRWSLYQSLKKEFEGSSASTGDEP